MSEPPVSLPRRTLARAVALASAAMLALTCARWATADGDGWPASPLARTMPPLDGAVAWINAAPLDARALRGRVVLVDFWTYSCINCLRTLPWLRAWSGKYGPHGLVVVGVHTPEFDFEGSVPDVRRAVKDLGITWPVAVDSRHAVWNAFGVRAWPTMLFVDAQGRVRDQQRGEGGYGVAERRIQQLLREAGRQDVPGGLVAPRGEGTQAAADPRPPLSSETCVGAARAEGFVSASGDLSPGRATTFLPAPQLDAGQWTLAGRWQVADDRLEAAGPGARIVYRFRARDLHLVLAKAGGRPLRFRVRIDGHAPGVDRGSDVDAEGRGVIDARRLYQLVRQAGDGREARTFEIEFLDVGAQAYSFTFG